MGKWMNSVKYSQGGQYLPNFKENLLSGKRNPNDASVFTIFASVKTNKFCIKKQLELMHEQMVDLELADC